MDESELSVLIIVITRIEWQVNRLNHNTYHHHHNQHISFSLCRSIAFSSTFINRKHFADIVTNCKLSSLTCTIHGTTTPDKQWPQIGSLLCGKCVVWTSSNCHFSCPVLCRYLFGCQRPHRALALSFVNIHTVRNQLRQYLPSHWKLLPTRPPMMTTDKTRPPEIYQWGSPSYTELPWRSGSFYSQWAFITTVLFFSSISIKSSPRKLLILSITS